jgi:hypothetical protein
MATQAFMGAGELIPRIMAQVGDASFGIALAKKNGLLNADGSMSDLGRYRNGMTAEQRAIDRAGGTGIYNKYTNRVTQSIA